MVPLDPDFHPLHLRLIYRIVITLDRSPSAALGPSLSNPTWPHLIRLIANVTPQNPACSESGEHADATMGPSRRREFGFAFVPVDDAGKPKGSSNVGLVRRHCMKGKNRTIGVPPKRVGARPPQKRYAQTSADGQHVAAERDHRDEDEEDAWSSVWDSLTLPLAPSTISLIQLAFHVDNRGKGLLFRCKPPSLAAPRARISSDRSNDGHSH